MLGLAAAAGSLHQLDRGDHDHFGVPAQNRGQLRDELRGKDRLVPLDVDDDVLGRQVEERRGFGQAVAARGVVLPGHEGLAAESGDAIPDAPIIGGHPDPVQILHLQGLLIGPLDQGLPQDQRQGFARKAGGAEAGRDDGDGFHSALSRKLAEG